MAPNPEVATISIDSLRANDEKNDVSPEKQTLNSARVLSFLRRNGVNGNNWESVFRLELAIALTNEGKTSTEVNLNNKFKEAEKILSKYNHQELMLEKSEAVVSSKLENYKTPPINMSAAEAAKIMQAWSYFNLIREHSRRLLEMESTMRDTREKAFGTGKDTTETITDTVKDKLGDARERWDTLSGQQKLVMAGMALLAGVMLFKSQNETLKKIKETLMTGVKVAGAAWLFNKVWYLFTGEGVLDTVSGTTKGGGKQTSFLKESFHTDDQGSEIMSKAFVQMGDASFLDLAGRYDAAVKSGKRTIEGTRMSGGEAFKAMEIFFNKYSYESTIKEYAKYNPPIAFNQVVTIEMAKDPSVKLQEALLDRVYDGTGDYLKRSWNYMATTWPAVWLSKKYEKWFGKKPTEVEIKEFVQKFSASVKTENEINGAISDKMVPDKAISKKFVETNLAGKVDAKAGLKYKVAADGYVYMIVTKAMDNTQGDEKALSNIIQSSVESAENFLVEKFKVSKETATSKCTPYGSLFVSESGSLRYLVRYKIN